MPPPLYLAIGALVLGAVIVLLLVQPLSTRPTAASMLGLTFAIVAGGLGLSGGESGLGVVALCGVAALAMLLLPTLDAQVPAHVAESAALLLLGTAGAAALAGAGDLVQAVVGLETLALSAVTLVAVGAGARPLEAAFKYFVLGAISLAGLLFGVGLVYLGNGSVAFPTAAQVGGSSIVLAGFVLIALGFSFELAIVPFHWGALDAYTAAAPSLAGYVMSVSKLAAAYVLGRLVIEAGVPAASLLIWIGALTIVVGTFGALAQRDLRRLLAYSAVTHAGFIALAAGSGPVGLSTAVFYAVIYASMAMLTFAALAGVGEGTLRQLGPIRAGALALALLSLAGIPPTPGFWAKLSVLSVAWQAAGPVPTLVAIAGGVFSVLYYLRPLPDLFAAVRGDDPTPQPSAVPAMLLAAIVVVVFGVFPGLAWAIR